MTSKIITAILLLALMLVSVLLAACESYSTADDAGRLRDARPLAEEEALPWGSIFGVPGSAKEGEIAYRQYPVGSPVRLTQGFSPIPFIDAGRAVRGQMPPGTLPALDEEVWVITRAVAQTPASDDIPGCGSLMTERHDADGFVRRVPLPLAHTGVEANIEAYIASVTVDQQFQNPFDETIEALYVFPLPENAGINGFVMEVGERRIRGIIRDRAEAEAIYAEARAQGHRASLLTQERPNIFTQKVANLEPGLRIDVEITYFHTLQYDDGWYEYVFPMVVGPRFNPPGYASGIGAVARGASAGSTQPTNVEYLAPNERSGHDIDVNVTISGLDVETVMSPSHDITVLSEHSTTTEVALARHDRVPNRDFVLRYRVAAEKVQASLLAHSGERGGHFTLMLHPPASIADLERAPIEMVFVIDCSGSMSGKPIAQAKDAVLHALGHLRAGDSFQIIRFSNDASTLGPAPIEATPKNVARGRKYVKGLRANGGTQMIRGITAALEYPHDRAERQRYVTFMTDGFIGNEVEILAAINESLGPSRIFSFGVGSAPNRYLLARMAKTGMGAVAYLGLDDDAGAVMDRYVERIAHPAMMDLAIDWGRANVTEVFPERLPDLFVGRPVVITGRYQGDAPPVATVAGTAGGFRVEAVVEAGESDAGPATVDSALPVVWARMKIADLADRSAWDQESDLPARIRQLALEYGLMSAYTAFIAVDASTKVDPGAATVPVAVPVPRGVEYGKTVGG